MNEMQQLEQTRFFHYFKEISRIPRGSGDEKRISGYVADFARRLGLEYVQDDIWNVVIYKPAQGDGSRDPVILQCHMDMVCEKATESSHDFAKDPIVLLEENGCLTADGTTLGCDNGMGMAYILAVLESETLAHPPIEAIFTTSEEVGLEGMAGLDSGLLNATRMINLDAEEEGVFVTSCAGGVRLHLELPAVRMPAEESAVAWKITVDGLVGGHSGLDIGLGRANAIVLLGRVLQSLGELFHFQVESLWGGAKTNSIPWSAGAVVWLRPEDKELVSQSLDELQADFRREYAHLEPGLALGILPEAEARGAVLHGHSLDRALAGILMMPCGVLGYSPHLAGVVDSSCSIGVLECSDDNIRITSMARANVESRMEDTLQRARLLAKALDGVFFHRNRYGAWEYRAGSSLQATCGDVYRDFSGGEACFASIHAGLECALMAERRPEMDIISMGPTIHDAHTPSERVEIDSLMRMWDYLKRLLVRL